MLFSLEEKKYIHPYNSIINIPQAEDLNYLEGTLRKQFSRIHNSLSPCPSPEITDDNIKSYKSTLITYSQRDQLIT